MVRRVSAIEAHALLRDEGFVYVDVRSSEEIAAGLPSGAYHVPLSLMTSEGMVDNRDFIRVMQSTFAADQKLVIGCASGVRSLRAATLLMHAGFTHVIDQRGGYAGQKDAFGRTTEPGWMAAGLPIDSDVEPERSYGVLSQRKNAT